MFVLLHYKYCTFYKKYNVWTYRVLAIENITLMNAHNFLNVVLDLVLNSFLPRLALHPVYRHLLFSSTFMLNWYPVHFASAVKVI